MKNFGNWIINVVKEWYPTSEMLGTAALALIVLAVLFISAFIFICVKYIRLNKSVEAIKSNAAATKDDLRYAEKDKKDLEESLIFVKEQLEKEKAISQDLCSTLKEKNIIEDNLKKELEEAKKQLNSYKEAETKKRSESAKKAAETRRQNKLKKLEKRN